MARAVILLATVCALQAVALADEKSDAAIRDAEALAAAGDFLAAADKYREAYALDRRVELMCNVGIAYHKAKDLPRAQLFLSHCLKRGTALDQTFVNAVRGVLAMVEAGLKAGDFTPVDIDIEPETTSVSIPTLVTDAFVGPHLVWLPFGKHELVFSAGEHIDQTLTITAENRDTLPLRVVLQKRPKPKTERVIETRRSKIPAIAASVFTVVAIGYAVYAYDQASTRAEIAAKAINMQVYDDDTEYISSKNNQMALASLLAVVGAGASGYLWYRAMTPSTRVEVARIPGGAQIVFGTTF